MVRWSMQISIGIVLMGISLLSPLQGASQKTSDVQAEPAVLESKTLPSFQRLGKGKVAEKMKTMGVREGYYKITPKGEIWLIPKPAQASESGPVSTKGEQEKQARKALSRKKESISSIDDLLQEVGLWINLVKDGHLLVSKIHQVDGIYVVTLVEDAPPYSLNSHLIVRASDGRMVALERLIVSVW